MIPNSLKDIYDQTEALKGRRLITILVVIVLLFLSVGIMLGNFMESRLKNDEPTPDQSTKTPNNAVVTIEGTVTYVGPDYLPAYEINYTLTDNAGNDIVLLKSSDDKLEIVQGLFVKVTGRKYKSEDGKYDILQVNEVVIKNGS